MTGIRRAQASDAPSLAVLAERTFRDTFGPRNSPENMDSHCAKVFGPEIQLREIGERGLVTTLARSRGPHGRLLAAAALAARTQASPQNAPRNSAASTSSPSGMAAASRAR